LNMFKQRTSLLLLCLSIVLGCRQKEPTNVSPINNSARLLHGTLTIGNESIPFDHLSNYAGYETFAGGETLHAELTDLWSNETFTLTSTIPPCPSDDPYITLLVEVDKNLNLDAKWKSETRDLESIHFSQYSNSFNCLPIVVKNDGNRKDFVIRIRQDEYSYALRRNETESNDDMLYYGFLHRGKQIVRNNILISYNKGPTLETTIASIPIDTLSENQDISAVYVYLNQEMNTAMIHFLHRTTNNPRDLAESIKINREIIPLEFLEVTTSKIDKEFRRLDFRLPDLEELP
jgi:hypothetical protein